MSRSAGSSHRWRQRQERDPYVTRAVREGWRSRAVFKLAEIDERERLLGAGLITVDLGAAPGSWSQYAAAKVGGRGAVIAMDLLPVEPIPGVDVLVRDFTTPEGLEALGAALAGRAVDLVMSDMAPNISGNAAIDQPRSMGLADEALLFARETLKPGGTFLVKLFQGEGFEAYVNSARSGFRRVKLVKPKASRAASREIYLLARQFRM
jgi:23S rRNA (uridine2552-2'-O)-methyltransferase